MSVRAFFLSTIFSITLPQLAAAQSIEIIAPSRDAGTEAMPAPAVEAEPLLGDEALARALTFDPVDLTRERPLRDFRRPAPKVAPNWTRTPPSPNGQSTLQVRQPITTSEWNAAIGGELAIAGTPPAHNEFEQPLPGSVKDPRAGAAWANVEVPDLATFEARVAPSEDQRRASAGVQRDVPIGDAFSVALESRVTVTETNPNAGLLPAPLGMATIWGHERSAKFNVLRTGTTFAAAATDTTDPNLNNRTYSVAQKIYGPLHVTTAITNPGHANVSKSIGAGVKFDW